jgi:quinol monooxygenase YgiN
VRYIRAMTVVVVATLSPAPQARDQVIAVLEDLIPRVHAEDGCELYALHENDDGRLVMIERWSSGTALDLHLRGPALAEMSERLRELDVPRADVQVLRAHPAGTPAQGTVAGGTGRP